MSVKIFSLILTIKEAPQHTFLRPGGGHGERRRAHLHIFLQESPGGSQLCAQSSPTHNPGGPAHLPQWNFHLSPDSDIQSKSKTDGLSCQTHNQERWLSGELLLSFTGHHQLSSFLPRRTSSL